MLRTMIKSSQKPLTATLIWVMLCYSQAILPKSAHSSHKQAIFLRAVHHSCELNSIHSFTRTMNRTKWLKMRPCFTVKKKVQAILLWPQKIRIPASNSSEIEGGLLKTSLCRFQRAELTGKRADRLLDCSLMFLKNSLTAQRNLNAANSAWATANTSKSS